MTRWMEIPAFNGLYEVSDHGEVRRTIPFRGSTTMKPVLMENGYLGIKLRRPGFRLQTYLHILVAEAFVDGRTVERNEVGHNDGNKRNCQCENLVWQTRSENNTHKNRILFAHHNQRSFVLTGPEDQKIETDNLTVTCEQLRINASALHGCLKGRRNHHKGWKITRAEQRLTLVTD